MTMRLYLIAADTSAPLQLALAKGQRAVDAAKHVIDFEDAYLTPLDGWKIILDELEKIASDKREEESEYQAPPPRAPDLPLEGGSSVPAALRDADPDAWRAEMDSEIGEVAY